MGVHRLELWTSRMSSERSNQLSYTPGPMVGASYLPTAADRVNPQGPENPPVIRSSVAFDTGS